jgi:hypothetical protein
MAYERQISPTSIDELSTMNCNAALGFVGLTASDMPPNEHNSHNSEGKDCTAICNIHRVMCYSGLMRQRDSFHSSWVISHAVSVS